MKNVILIMLHAALGFFLLGMVTIYFVLLLRYPPKDAFRHPQS